MREGRPLDSDAHNLATLLLLRDVRRRQCKQSRPRERRASATAKPVVAQATVMTRPQALWQGDHAATPPQKAMDLTSSRQSSGSRSPNHGPRGSPSGSPSAESASSPSNSLGVASGPESPEAGRSSLINALEMQRRLSSFSAPKVNVVGLGNTIGGGVRRESEISLGVFSPNELVSQIVSPSESSAAEDAVFASPGGALDAARAERRRKRSRTKRRVDVDMCMIAVEILEPRTKSTLQSEPSIRAAADYLLSHSTMSKVLAMVLMQREVKGVLEELLSEEASGFFVHRASRFAVVGERASFWEISSRALACGEVLVGFRPTSSGVTIINPVNKDQLRVWGEFDLIVVCCDSSKMMTPAALNFKRLRRYTSLPMSLARCKAAGGDGEGEGAASGQVPVDEAASPEARRVVEGSPVGRAALSAEAQRLYKDGNSFQTNDEVQSYMLNNNGGPEVGSPDNSLTGSADTHDSASDSDSDGASAPQLPIRRARTLLSPIPGASMGHWPLSTSFMSPKKKKGVAM